MRLVWPCQPGLFASRLPTRFSTAIAVLTIEFAFGIHKQRAPKSLATPPLKQCFLRLGRTPVANINDIIKKLALSESCIMLHPNAKALIIAADSWARVKALPARKRQVHHPEEAPSSVFTRQSLQIRSKFCRGRASKQAWDPARAEHRCRAQALVRTKAATLGIPLGPNPRQGKDQHRHAREFNATRRHLQGPKRPGSLARSGSRSGLAKASEATLGIPLRIPLDRCFRFQGVAGVC